jgi:hypothetical protein
MGLEMELVYYPFRIHCPASHFFWYFPPLSVDSTQACTNACQCTASKVIYKYELSWARLLIVLEGLC